MSRVTQSRQQAEANSKVLRALVKSADNKVCVDCKKNDPRWASWNLGCFLCIRCSGIHRSMGTHISKVKSIDLDIWTPEQMESVQKWGNRRCNLYWEAHLKAGHVPADHKIESFIRSKYESRRWAKDGPPPTDPSVLDGAQDVPAASASTSTGAAAPAPTAARVVQNKPAPAIDLLDDPSPAPATAPAAKTTASATKPAPAEPAPAPKPATAAGGGGGIFDLDWHEPSTSTNASSSATSPTTTSSGAKGKNDIMSLFAAKPAAPAPTTTNTGFGDFSSFATPASTTNNASSGLAGLNSSFGGLDLSASKPASNGASFASGGQNNPWSSNTTSVPNSAGGGGGGGGLFDTQDVWGSSGATASTTASKPKDDAFADIWGDFK
ncbi:related to AGE2-ADP-ribosylation factor and GTPase activating protein effector [Sporisorium scitamineum]|uniref:Related to AGE2-ADP-ribosylation factor and GTPase activating protein effector n=1 Tax=Sporisorium scitamineum TaxID=49012 RepID=A0A127ZI47_9BASI|nr:related to AGE2-ADP-ribosylation factor and GTPase activating protein effector [Sporisorium scitamineum]